MRGEDAGDNLGAVAGPLLAGALVAFLGIRPAMYLAAIPGLFAAIAITIAAREARRHRGAAVRPPALELAALRQVGLFRALAPVAAFELGNVATTLLILRATQLLHTGGRSLDRAGPRLVLASGALCYLLAYAGFAVGPTPGRRCWPASCWPAAASGWRRPPS